MTPAADGTAWMSMPVAGLAAGADGGEPAELVVRNARVFTGDPRRPAASAVAIVDGQILNVSGDHGVARHLTGSTRVVDALGRRVSPGMIDSHLHAIRTGLHYLTAADVYALLRQQRVDDFRQVGYLLHETRGTTTLIGADSEPGPLMRDGLSAAGYRHVAKPVERHVADNPAVPPGTWPTRCR